MSIAMGFGCGEVKVRADAGDTSNGDGMTGDGGSGGANLTVSPTTYEFGAVYGTSTAATFTFTNTGDAPATGCSAPVKGGAHSGDFSITTDNCATADLAANASCTVLVQVTPATNGLRTMTLSRTCDSGGTASTDADAIAVNRTMYIFISQVSYNGNLGGLAGADALCQQMGDSGSLTSPLNKTWKALLSKATGGTVDAKSRFVWTGPMMDLGNKMVTADPAVWPWLNPSNGTSKISINQNGGGPDDSYVWSGTVIDGTAKGTSGDCNGWTSDTNAYNGWAGQTSNYPAKDWIDSFSSGCESQFYGLHCISQ